MEPTQNGAPVLEKAAGVIELCVNYGLVSANFLLFFAVMMRGFSTKAWRCIGLQEYPTKDGFMSLQARVLRNRRFCIQLDLRLDNGTECIKQLHELHVEVMSGLDDTQG